MMVIRSVCIQCAETDYSSAQSVHISPFSPSLPNFFTIFAQISPYLTRSGQHFHSAHSASLFTNSFTQCGESSTLLLLFHPAHIRPKVYFLHSVHNVLKKWVVLVVVWFCAIALCTWMVAVST